MRSLGTRRAVQVASVATAAVIALAGCSAGQVAETALLQTPISGLNAASADGGLLIRNLQVIYKDPAGYPANGTAALEGSLFNQTQQPITVTITSKPAKDAVAARQVTIVGDAPTATVAAEPSGGSTATPSEEPTATQVPPASATPSAPGESTPGESAPADAAGQPAKLTIAPLGSVAFLPGGPTKLQVAGLSGALVPGDSLALSFQIGTNPATLDVLAPVAIPLTAPSRVPGAVHENAGEHGTAGE